MVFLSKKKKKKNLSCKCPLFNQNLVVLLLARIELKFRIA